MELTKWQLLHEYIKRSKMGEFTELDCIMCAGPVILLDKNDAAVLWCPFDDTEETVGTALLEHIKEALGATYV